MSETFPLDGEIVEVTQVSCATRGIYTEYHASFEHNGTPMPQTIRFKEDVAELFRKAGHNVVKYQRGHIIPVAHVEVVLGVFKNKYSQERYCITAVFGIDGKTWHKLEDVGKARQANRPKRKKTPFELKQEANYRKHGYARFGKTPETKPKTKPVSEFQPKYTGRTVAEIKASFDAKYNMKQINCVIDISTLLNIPTVKAIA